MDIKTTHALCEELQARNNSLLSTIYITRWDLQFDWRAPIGAQHYRLDIRGFLRRNPSKEFAVELTGSDLLEVSTRAARALDALAQEASTC